MNLILNMHVFWFVLLLIFLAAELATSISLTSIWFCVGALGAIIAASLGLGIVAQSVIFIVISLLMLFLTRPFLHKVLGVKYEATNADKILGTSCLVLERIDNRSNTGSIKFEGKVWTARSIDNDTIIEQGTEVVVEKIQGVTAYVKQEKRSEI